MEMVTIASATATAGILAAGASRVALATWRRAAAVLQQHNYQSQLRSSLQQQADRARMAGLAHWQNCYGQTSPWRVMQVVEVADESLDVRSFYLQDPLNPALCTAFQPGQFLIVRPAMGGADMPSRCYSLSDAPGQEWYRISVKRQAYAKPQGRSLSNWLHDHIQAGDCLLVAGPHGQFVMEDTASTTTPVAFLAAGVGITPMLSMLKAQLAVSWRRPCSLFFQAQDDQHWPFGQLVHNWANQCPSLQVASFFSRLREDQLPVVAAGTAQPGKYNAESLFATVPDPLATEYFMCGPDTWMQNMREGLQQLGVPPMQIHYESFTGPDPSQNTGETVAEWQIDFARSGIQTQPSLAPSTILAAALENGITIPSVCQTGACGSCKLKLLKGAVKYNTRPTCTHQPDEVLACIAQPIGGIEVDA